MPTAPPTDPPHGQDRGPCATCHTPIRRYGPGATTLCPACLAALVRKRPPKAEA